MKSDDYDQTEDKDARSCLQITPYISEVDAENLRNYQYFGGSNGFSDIYFYNPFATWCVSKIPETIAPNLVSSF